MSCSRLAAVVFAVAALAFSGCGSSKTSSGSNDSVTSSGSSQTASTASSTSSQALIASATHICTHARTQVGAMKATSKRALRDDLAQAATYVQAAVEELSRLKAEPALAPDLQRITAALHMYSVEATKASELLATKDQGGARKAFLAYKRANTAVIATAKRDGLSVCTTFL